MQGRQPGETGRSARVEIKVEDRASVLLGLSWVSDARSSSATRPAWNGRCAGKGAPLGFQPQQGSRADPAVRGTLDLENISLPRLGTFQLLRIPKPWNRTFLLPHLGAQKREVRFSLFFLLPIMKLEKSFAPLWALHPQRRVQAPPGCG